MGSGASLSVPGLLTRTSSKNKMPDKGNSIQDDARSFRSKTGAIKMLIRAEESRLAFRAYIVKTHPKGEVEYLDYYLAVEALKKRGVDKAELHQAFLLHLHLLQNVNGKVLIQKASNTNRFSESSLFVSRNLCLPTYLASYNSSNWQCVSNCCNQVIPVKVKNETKYFVNTSKFTQWQHHKAKRARPVSYLCLLSCASLDGYVIHTHLIVSFIVILSTLWRNCSLQ